jgi:putative SOS response-associated peptidase YedK
MSKQEPVDKHKRSSIMTRDEWLAWLDEAWAEAQKIAASDELRPMPSDQDARLALKYIQMDGDKTRGTQGKSQDDWKPAPDFA